MAGGPGASGWLADGSDPESAIIAPQPPAGFAEAFIAPKSGAEPCEDALVITPHFVAVVDGMSSPLRGSSGRRSGRDYALAAARQIATLPAEATARQAVDAITAVLAGIAPGHDGPAGCVAAIYSSFRRQVWRVGDVHVAIGELALPAHKAVDAAMAGFRAAVNAARLAAGTPLQVIRATDPGLAATRALLEAQPALANREVPYGYGVLDGSAVPTGLIEVHPVPEHSWVTLASDGYLSPARSLARAEQQLRAALAEDPASIGIMRDMGKALRPDADAPDDRTYVRFRVEPDVEPDQDQRAEGERR